MHKWFGQSPSSMKTFQSCPYRYKAQYLTREIQWKETEANAFGTRFHKAAEDTINYGIDVPPEFSSYEPVINIVHNWPGRTVAEVTYAVDADGMSVGWGQREVGCKIDIVSFGVKPNYARILDWKTGKPYPDYLQLDINALTTFAANPGLDRIRAAYYYLKFDKLDTRDYVTGEKQKETDIPIRLIKEQVDQQLLRQHAAHENDAFPQTPNGLCRRWCDAFSCPHNGRNPDGSEK